MMPASMGERPSGWLENFVCSPQPMARHRSNAEVHAYELAQYGSVFWVSAVLGSAVGVLRFKLTES
jgi:hypothetical protein